MTALWVSILTLEDKRLWAEPQETETLVVGVFETYEDALAAATEQGKQIEQMVEPGEVEAVAYAFEYTLNQARPLSETPLPYWIEDEEAEE